MTDQTDTTTQPDLPVDAEIGPRFVNTTYVNDAPAPVQDNSKPRPTPAGYFLRFGTVQAAFKAGNKGISAKTGEPYAFPDEVVVLPYLTIVSDADGGTEFAGVPVNPYHRLTSTRVERKRGVFENYSTLSSAMAAVGLDMPVGEAVSVDDLIAAAEAMSGLTTLHPVYCSYAAEFKSRPYLKLGDGTTLRLSEKAFRRDDTIKGGPAAYKAAGGTWARLGWILDPENDLTRSWTLTQPSDNVDHKRVFANFQPTDSGFQAKG